MLYSPKPIAIMLAADTIDRSRAKKGDGGQTGSRQDAGRYSHMRCVGNLEHIEAIEGRTCVFENICHEPSSDEFIFYSRRNESVPLLYDHRRGEQRRLRWRKAGGDEIDADFATLSKFVSYKHRNTWSAVVHESPLPPDYSLLKGTFALSAPFVPTNLGHVAWDEAFPLLVAMAQLGVYTPALNILRTHRCEELSLRTNSSTLVCNKFAHAFLSPLTGAQPLDSPPRLQTLPDLAAAHPRSTLCFERLLVGGSFDAFNSEALNVGKEPLLALFRHRVLAWHAIDPTAVPSRHQILLVRKQGRRAIANFAKVEAFVRARFEHVAKVVVTDYSSLTMREQLQIVASSTIAISPCGGISMILPFLPEGAYAILLNYLLGADEPRRHGECEGCSWSMEAELWRHVRHVNKMYYQVWDASDFSRSGPGRDSSVRVKPPRLARLIEAALEEMQPR
uniref:Glycosyltransferase 61 catalytic domain-containing protein n=1 Tax=Coccolithus braarudii TaxID=221442 RepID=A0A7S0L8S3_9EUKA